MEEKYREWIRANVDGDGAGLCFEYATLLCISFPELSPVHGEYTEPGSRSPLPHAWAVDQTGIIIDPTEAQFRPGGTYTEEAPIDRGSRELLLLSLQAASIITKQPLAPDNTYVAFRALEIMERFQAMKDIENTWDQVESDPFILERNPTKYKETQ